MADWETAIAHHDEQIKTLFERQKEIKELTESVHALALSLHDQKGELDGINGRLERIEEAAKYKYRTVWACIVTGVLGAAVAAFMAGLLG